jgi:capsular exopolysaccharide synthesis family protein
MSRFFEATLRRQDISGRLPAPEATGPDQNFHIPDAAPPTDNIVRAAGDSSFRAPAGFRVVPAHGPAAAPSPSLDSAEQAFESYRIIRTKIVQHPRGPRVICISSSTPGDGKTATAVNIAGSLALKRDTTAILVDTDLRRPRLAGLLGVPGSPGLAEVLAGTCSVQEAVVRVGDLPSLYFLPAGRCSTNPSELLDSDRWQSVAKWLQSTFTFTILDSPPVGMVADYDLIQSVCQGILLVVRPGHTNRKLLQKSIDQMPSEKLLGVVVNAVDDWFLWRTNGHYYDGYYRCNNQE